VKIFYLLIFLVCFSSINYSQEKLDVFDVARKGTVVQAKELFETNVEIFNTVNTEGYSPLIIACYRGNNEVAKFIVKVGGNINSTSNMGTALMAAVVKRNLEMVKLLLDNHADVNISDVNGTTALIYATMFKNYDIVSLLVKANANSEFKDNRGNSAIDYAVLADDDKLIEILKTK
jgi:uncharacterized protein